MIETLTTQPLNLSTETVKQIDNTLAKVHQRIDDLYLVTIKVLRLLEMSEDRGKDIRETENNMEKFKRDLQKLDEMTDIYEELVPYINLVAAMFPDFYHSDLMDRLAIHSACNNLKKMKHE